MSDGHWRPPRKCSCPHGAGTEPDSLKQHAPAGCRRSGLDPARHGRAFSVAHGDADRSACLIMQRNISIWNCLKYLFQAVEELAQRDPWKLADLKHEMVKASREEVARTSRLAA